MNLAGNVKRRIVRLRVEGWSNEAVSSLEVGLAESTVRFHLARDAESR